MADKNVREANLANAIAEAEYAVAQANAAGAGPGRVERIQRADDALLKAQGRYDDCRAQRGYK